MADPNPRAPLFFLAWALDAHPGGDGVEISAHLVAPTLIRPEFLDDDARAVLVVAGGLVRSTGHRLVFFSELTAALAADGESWETREVDWAQALRTLSGPGVPGFDFGLYHRDWLAVVGGSRYVTVLDGDDQVTLDVAAERDRLREVLTPLLYQQWDTFISPHL